jgi:Short-chain alcohol dehydrogenase of unknown specificity
MKNNWTTENIGSLEGKTIIITGGSSGIGLEAARVLSSKGANVIIAVRNLEKGESAAREIKEVYPKAIIEVMHIELSDLESVKKFAETFALKYSRLDILINNAGVMVPPLKLTKQGYELLIWNKSPCPFCSHRTTFTSDERYTRFKSSHCKQYSGKRGQNSL